MYKNTQQNKAKLDADLDKKSAIFMLKNNQNNEKKETEIMCKINGKKVVELRTARKMTQKELAKKAGLSSWSVSQFETGKSNANDESIEKIAQALGVNPNEIDLDSRKITKDIIENRRSSLKMDASRRYMTPMETQEMVSKLRFNNPEIVEKEAKRAMTKTNQSTVGNKTYAVVEAKALNIPKWQRNTDREKCHEISQAYDENKYDPIKVYVVEGKLYVADGAHRLIAYILMGVEYILVEIMNIKTEKEAAETFLLQSLGRKSMSQNDMWRAAIEANLPQYCQLRQIALRHNVQIQVDLYKLSNPVGYMNVVSRSILRMAHKTPELLTREFELIAALGWNGSESSPYRTYVFKALEYLYAQYKGREEELETQLMIHCCGAGYFDRKIATTSNKARLVEVLIEDMTKGTSQKTA